MATKKQTTTDDTMSTREVAEAIGTTPRELRVFLRASDEYQAVGAGKRYAFTQKDVAPMKKRYEAWRKARDEAKAATEETSSTEDAGQEPTPEDEAPKRASRTARKSSAA